MVLTFHLLKVKPSSTFNTIFTLTFHFFIFRVKKLVY